MLCFFLYKKRTCYVFLYKKKTCYESREWGPITGIMEALLLKASCQHILGEIVPPS